MTPRIKFIFASSFLMGVITGGYVFITFFAPEYGDDGFQSDTLTITGQAYGGCDRGGFCSSFQLREGGAYQYLSSDDAVMEAGTLPSSLYRSITSELTSSQLDSFAQPQAIRDCISYVDGIDYTYNITQHGKLYKLDTCTTGFPHQSKLQEAFIDAFRYMSDPTQDIDTTTSENTGFDDWLINRFQNN